MDSCKDIFRGVYYQVRGSYISNLYSSKVKSKTVSESEIEDENLTMNATSSPVSETNVNTKEITGNTTETVTESVERAEEDDVIADIKMDLEEKFPYALAAVCGNLAKLDRFYREMNEYDEQPEFSEFLIDIEDAFPLSDRFIFPCILYISSMMLIDIDEEKSDHLYEKYASHVAQIASEIPFKNSAGVEKYPY